MLCCTAGGECRTDASSDRRKPFTATGTGGARKVRLNPRLQSALAKVFPGFRMAAAKDYDPAPLEGLSEGMPELQKASWPFACTGDFNGDGIMDAAVVLLRGSSDYLVAACEQTRGGGFIIRRLDAGRSAGIDDRGRLSISVQREAKGGRITYLKTDRYLERGIETRVLRLKHDAVSVEWWDKAARLYFRSRRGYRYVQTGD
jgi:hypothetical protein